MTYLRTFEQSFALDTQRLLACLLWAEAMYCRAHRVSATRADGLVAIVGEYIAACGLIAKA
ncbi:MAG: hypothetical protein ACKV2T_15940 [Kofleriaceae bacterium]